ncbi:MAG: adenylate/guanylate cyclase domain-containing protein [Archangium sp.]|nr:adenylate/guanylate cyclase domain-containing protein [Archangium sp.]
MRFVQKFGVAFLWATIVGVLFGGAAYFRVERRELEGEPRWHVYPRLWLELAEARTVDWRARELGRTDDRADGVVLINVDEDTLSNARESEHPEWAMRPWPRELLGAVAEQAVREGASMVFIDESFADVSARQCSPCRGEDPRTDDQRFAERLRGLGGKVVLGFDWHRETRRAADRPLMPLLMRVAEVDTEAQTFPFVRRVLLQRTTAYVVQSEGRFTVWAGSTGEAQTKDLAAALELKGSPQTRSLTPADDAAEVGAQLLLQKLAHVEVQGFDAESAPRAGAVDAPVPALLMPEVATASMRLIADPDGVVRSVPLLVNTSRTNDGGALVPGVALRIRPGAPGTFVVEGGYLKGVEQPGVPVDSQGFLALRWSADEAGRSGRGTLKRAVPAWRLLVNREDDEAGRGVRHHDNDLAGRVVVLVDERSSPVLQTPVGLLTRGAIWAQAISNVARGQGIRRVEPQLDFWLTLAFAFAGAILAVAWSSLMRRPGWLAWVATIGLVFVVQTLLARQLYVTQQRQVVMLAPIFACSLTFLASLGYARTLEQSLRDFVLRALGGAVRADVFRRVERDLALMRPERRELTIFFSDIEGFTSVSNEKDPAVVVDVLRDYLSEMTTLVLDRGGHVDKYLGDGLMAFWGAPVATPNDAESACEAAILMQARFDEKRAEWEKKCGRTLVLRAGIETGDTVVGEMGTLHRVNYTVMGEPVATAARLEALAKRYGVRTLVGETLVEEAKDAYLFRPLDTVRMGREGQPIRISELLAPLTAHGFEWVRDYEAAWLAWNERRFADALTAFQALAAARPDDTVVRRYVARCTAFLAAAPAPSWDGIYDGD